MSEDVEVLTSTEACAEFGLSRSMMTRLLRSDALPFTTDPLDKRLKLVKRGDVARLAAISRKRPCAHPTHRHMSRKECMSKSGEPTYTLGVGELMAMLYAFAPYLDVARGDLRQFRDEVVVLDTAQTFYELIEEGCQAGKPMDEILNSLCVSRREPGAPARIQEMLHDHLTKRESAA